MRIGVTYDLRDDYRALGFSEEDAAEFDHEETIAAICGALSSLGYTPARIGNVKRLVERLASGERFDGVFNFCEGLKGVSREAQVPAILEAYDVPYVFSDPLTCALTLDKAMTKRVLRDAGVPTADFAVIEKIEDAEIVYLPLPLFLKPVAEGSGKGIGADNLVRDRASLKRVAGNLLQRFKQPVLVESYLAGREYTVGVTGTGEEAEILGVSQIRLTDAAAGAGYGFENKNDWVGKVEIIDARGEEAGRAGAVALGAWRALRCRDGGRVDIRCDGEGNPHFIEVNPLAGLRPGYSDLCFIAEFNGLSYRDLIGKIMASFQKRYPDLKKPCAS
jgi:D-alanine-D-alanine ligase